MQVFYHLIYEYQKGLRDLCLFTCTIDLLQKVEKSLNLQGIEHLILRVGKDKMNAFFGMPACLKIVKQFSSQNLSVLTPEEDFILGMMLGYAKAQQYERFLKMKCDREDDRVSPCSFRGSTSPITEAKFAENNISTFIDRLFLK